MDEGTLNHDTLLCPENTPLSDTERNWLITAHYLTFAVCTAAIYSIYAKIDLFKQRIFSPFLLLIGMVWLQIGPAFEIGNHFYVNNWELYESTADLINGSFSFLNFGAQNINAISLKKKGVFFLRLPNKEKGLAYLLLDCVVILADILFVILVFIQPVLYATIGRSQSNTIMSPFAGIAGIFSLFRLWFNLGPNPYTKWGGIFFLALSLVGVGMFSLYKRTCVEIYHLFIGGSFVFSVIPFTVALWNIEPAKQESGEKIEDEISNEDKVLDSETTTLERISSNV